MSSISLLYEDNRGNPVEMNGVVTVNDKKYKGYFIWTGKLTYKNDVSGSNPFFVKFIQRFDNMKDFDDKNYDSKDHYRRAVQRIQKEREFRMRYPFIAYVYHISDKATVTFEGETKTTIDVFFLLEEYCGDMSLAEYYRKNTPDKSTMYSHMLQILYGTNYYTMLQSDDYIIHRDLNPSNIMIHNNVIKIIDFDWSHVDQEMGTRDNSIAICGTPSFSHPLQNDKSLKKSFIGMDIYSIGLVFLYMVNRFNYIKKLEEAGCKNGHDYRLHLRFVDKQTPEWLRKIIAKMIAAPKDQYKYVSEVIRDFNYLLRKNDPKTYEKVKNDFTEIFHILPNDKNDDKCYVSLLVEEKYAAVKKAKYLRSIKNGEVFQIETSGKAAIRFLRSQCYLFYRITNSNYNIVENCINIEKYSEPINLKMPDGNKKVLFSILK